MGWLCITCSSTTHLHYCAVQVPPLSSVLGPGTSKKSKFFLLADLPTVDLVGWYLSFAETSLPNLGQMRVVSSPYMRILYRVQWVPTPKELDLASRPGSGLVPWQALVVFRHLPSLLRTVDPFSNGCRAVQSVHILVNTNPDRLFLCCAG